MSLIPWKQKEREENTGVSLHRFRNEMDRLFQSFFDEPLGDLRRNWLGATGWGPPVDVEETDKEILVRAEIPGMKAEEIELAMQGDVLVISGEKKESTERKEQGYVYQERHFGSFRRDVRLPAAIDADNVQAEYKDGVLHVTLHKAQEALPKKIQVQAK